MGTTSSFPLTDVAQHMLLLWMPHFSALNSQMAEWHPDMVSDPDSQITEWHSDVVSDCLRRRPHPGADQRGRRLQLGPRHVGPVWERLAGQHVQAGQGPGPGGPQSAAGEEDTMYES